MDFDFWLNDTKLIRPWESLTAEFRFLPAASFARCCAQDRIRRSLCKLAPNIPIDTTSLHRPVQQQWLRHTKCSPPSTRNMSPSSLLLRAWWVCFPNWSYLAFTSSSNVINTCTETCRLNSSSSGWICAEGGGHAVARWLSRYVKYQYGG